MDVLLGSIDVRDLLSVQDLDESSPLSAPDLRLLIDRLQIRSLHIKDKVRDYVLAHRQDFADIFSRCSQAASGADAAAVTLSDALRLLSDRPLDREIREIAEEIRSRRRELEERREALAMVQTVSLLRERLRSSREDLRAGRLVEASVAVRDLKAGLLVSGMEEVSGEKEPAVYGFLRKDWTECFDELQGVLAKIVESSVQFDLENVRVIVRSRSTVGDMGEVELHQALEAMEVVDVLDYGLAKMADLMIKYVMVPATSKRSINILVEQLNQDSDGKSEAILSLISSSEVQESLDGATPYAILIQIIKFIYRFICFENGTWMRCFGRLTWSRMSDLIITHFLSKAVPDDASKIMDFENIMKCTAEFETFLKEMMFISTTDRNEEKLSHFAYNVEVHFASRKRNEILANARNCLLQFDYFLSPENASKSSTHASGVVECPSKYVADLLFQPERCIVSKATFQLMKLVHEALKDACLSSTRVAKELYHAARDALLLYKAIVPIKLEKQLDSISQVPIVIYNDCNYLSQEILGLAFEYRADFPSGLKNQAVFVDLAPSFYQLAEDILQKQVQLVFSSLKEAIDGANGFQNTHQSQQYGSAKFSIEQVVFILEKVHIMWEPLMLASTYKKSMCTILDSTFCRITKDMLLLDDMAAEETLQLQRLIHMALENLSSLLESLIANMDEKEKVLNDTIWVKLDDMIPSLCKFRKLADLYDMPLKSIIRSWESGELLACGFMSSEIENFVKAIFADSPLRKECLWRIANTSR
ncbi:centromere/kinetochore protein zw10 homolog [Phoenix dactylifera]|uniref:Centromere/kinetochore protein zw10 homolog n=1 Tax=Phoenix dactylifera TaxID=42345 RepID=A0A8B7CHN4_PHODC|nr:centromere/kinetochore protein zw10 homolog [Phoenix dactylifera]